jgi:two-component system sporulation sensor kinase B
MVVFKDLLLNFFLIFICFFIIISVKIKTGNISKPFLFCLASLGVIFCTSFSIRLDENMILDLRLIPIIVAGLYGGWPITLALMLVNFLFRMWWGGTGIYSTIIVGSVVGVFISIISAKFLSLSLRNKLLLSIVIGGLAAIFEMIVISYYYQQPITNTLILIKIVLQTAAIFFLSFYGNWSIHIRDFMIRF